MTIPKLTPYTGEVANPDGSQTQSEFATNMFNQLSYEANLATELNATIDGMNQAVTDVENNAATASASANAAEALLSGNGYQGLWPDTGGSADKGDTYQTQVGGVPTGEYYTALQNTSVGPVGDDTNWKAVGTIGQQNLSVYTDIVYKASGGNSAIDNMLAFNPVATNVGDTCQCENGTILRRSGNATGGIDDYDILNYANVKDFGALGNNVDDDTAPIQLAIDSSEAAFVPPSSYRVDGTIYLETEKTLILAPKAFIQKPASASNEDPVIHIRGNFATLKGSGSNTSRIISRKRSPNGVILIGQLDMTDSPYAVNYYNVLDLFVQGSQSYGYTSGDPSIAILQQAPQITSNTVYGGTISNVQVRSVNYGLEKRGYANGDTITNIQGFHLGDESLNGGALIYDRGSLDNSVLSGFLNNSPNCAILKMEALDNTANGGVIHETQASTYNLAGEPGGALARGIVAQDGTVTRCSFDIRHNVAGGNLIDSGFFDRNTFIGLDSYREQIVNITQSRNIRKHKDVNAIDVGRDVYSQFNGMQEDETYKLVDVQIPTNQTAFMVELTFSTSGIAGVASEGGGNVIYQVRRSSSGTITADAIRYSKVGGNGQVCEAQISGNTVTIPFRCNTAGGATTGHGIQFKVELVGYFNTIDDSAVIYSSATTTLTPGVKLNSPIN